MIEEQERVRLLVEYSVMLPETINVFGEVWEIKWVPDHQMYSYMGSAKGSDVSIDCTHDGMVLTNIGGICVVSRNMSPLEDIDDVLGEAVSDIERLLEDD